MNKQSPFRVQKYQGIVLNILQLISRNKKKIYIQKFDKKNHIYVWTFHYYRYKITYYKNKYSFWRYSRSMGVYIKILHGDAEMYLNILNEYLDKDYIETIDDL